MIIPEVARHSDNYLSHTIPTRTTRKNTYVQGKHNFVHKP